MLPAARQSLILILLASTWALATEGPVAEWKMDEGRDGVIHDPIGHCDGSIHGARWVPVGKGYALSFNGVGDYVDCGEGPALNIKGPMTMEAWIHPDRMSSREPGIAGKFFESYALTYYQGSCHFYISSGGNNVAGPLPVGRWSHVVGVFDGQAFRFHINGREVLSKPSLFKEVKTGRHFTIGCVIGDPDNRDVEMRNTSFFAGKVDSVRVYDRPLNGREVILRYNEEAADKGLAPIDLDRLERVALQEFVYPEEKKLVVCADYGALKPLPEKAKIVVKLVGPKTGGADQSVQLEPNSPRGVVEATFTMDSAHAGEFEIQAGVSNAAGALQSQNTRRIKLSRTEAVVPSPSDNPVPPLPPRVRPPSFRASADPKGGIRIVVKDVVVPVESSFSHPGGGLNSLAADDQVAKDAEAAWKVKIVSQSEQAFKLQAEGAFYRLDRSVRVTPSRVLIEDTFTNKTDDVLGIIISNHIDSRKLRGAVAAAQPNGTVFVGTDTVGVGLLAMDDVYHVHCESTNAEGVAALRDPHFGLDKGASYTLAWAIYPTATARYFDFINQIRKDEGLNGRVQGSLALSGTWDIVSDAEIRNKGLAYYAGASLTRIQQNPMISLEGWEFMNYPDIRRRLKEWITTSRQRHPDMKIMFHVAHSLYLTNKPRELFPDSIAVDENGQADHYGPNTFEYHGSYISKDLFDQGWRWWLFYPTMDNSFGKLMLEATDVMIKELGANAIWADGFIEGYIKSGYTYDRWDGHSVTIDPKTGKVLKKKGNVTYLALPVLKELVRRFDAAGGIVMTNGRSGPLSFVKMRNVISSNETGGGDQQPVAGLYLGRTVTPLGNPSFIFTPEDIWLDILAKLDLGALYFWYGEREFVKEPTMVSHMYPITFESIDAGVVRGQERVVTRRSGVYGWPGDKSLHHVYAYDGRGRLRPNHHVSCADQDGVRTRLELGENEAAVVERLPITVQATQPVHLLLQQVGDDGLKMSLNGNGGLAIKVARDSYKFADLTSTKATLGGTEIALLRDENGLHCSLQLSGPATLIVGEQKTAR